MDILPKANCEHGYTLLPSMDQFIEDFQAIGAKVQGEFYVNELRKIAHVTYRFIDDIFIYIITMV